MTDWRECLPRSLDRAAAMVCLRAGAPRPHPSPGDHPGTVSAEALVAVSDPVPIWQLEGVSVSAVQPA